MSDAKIPVIVITGFLGSGKTTLLNRLLAAGPKTALIINEFGNMPVDQDLLQSQGMPMTVLSGGCLCCQIKGALAPTLKNLWMAWSRAAEKPFQRIIIETSGVASPEPILDTLLRERWLAGRYHLQQVITTLAMPSAGQQLQQFAEVRAQIAWADVLLLTHADRVSPGQADELKQHLQTLAPVTPQLTATAGRCDLQALLQLTGPVFRRLPTNATEMAHGFRSISVYLDQPPPWPECRAILQMLLDTHGDRLVRIKGVLFLPDQNDGLAIHAGAGYLYPPVALAGRENSDRRSRLVFIGMFDPQQLTAGLSDRLAMKADHTVIRIHELG